ncbi:unnamed protein product [Linum trigynum]|uniref:Uncharacterized protein n=1 Tax=Linum trigynum TaxID=586398 RepID=A0AAV2EM87_9ROSI
MKKKSLKMATLVVVVFLLLLLLITNPSISMADGLQADHLVRRKLLQMDLVLLDYEKDPGANTKHLPGPSKPGVGG